MISQINGLVHAKNTLPQHRIQKPFRPVLGQKHRIHPIEMIYAYFDERRKKPFKRPYFEILPKYAIISL
jgi:hypothetical protein